MVKGGVLAFLPLDLLNAPFVVTKFAFCNVFGTAQRGSNQVVHLAMSHKWIEIGSRDDELMRGSTVALSLSHSLWVVPLAFQVFRQCRQRVQLMRQRWRSDLPQVATNIDSHTIIKAIATGHRKQIHGSYWLENDSFPGFSIWGNTGKQIHQVHRSHCMSDRYEYGIINRSACMLTYLFAFFVQFPQRDVNELNTKRVYRHVILNGAHSKIYQTYSIVYQSAHRTVTDRVQLEYNNR